MSWNVRVLSSISGVCQGAGIPMEVSSPLCGSCSVCLLAERAGGGGPVSPQYCSTVPSGTTSSTSASFKSQGFPFQKVSEGTNNKNVPECSAGPGMICQSSFLDYGLFPHQQIM